jgi:magnesium chelatase subunit I
LVYEGEVEGPVIVAQNLLGKAIRTQFLNYFPDPEKQKKVQKEKNPYKKITAWFGDGNVIDLLNDLPDKDYRNRLMAVEGLEGLINQYHNKQDSTFKLFLMEFALHGLAEFSLLSKNSLVRAYNSRTC